MKKVLLYIGFLLLLLSIPLSAAGAAELAAGDMALDFPEGNNWFGGEKLSLADNAGKKATLLYFMKPGCGSCDKFAPHLYRLLLQHKDELSVVGITEYGADKIDEYLVKRMGDYPIMQDSGRAYMNSYIGVINKYPYVALIDKDGRLAWFGRGKFHSQITAEVERVLGLSEEPECINPEGKKLALVVGVDYTALTLSKLDAPENNARLTSEVLKEAGYSRTQLLTGSEATPEVLIEAMERLAKDTAETDSAVFFFSGEAQPESFGVGGIDLKLYLSDQSVSLRELVSKFMEAGESKNLLVVIDANTEKSKLKIWEDIAEEVGKAIPEATVLLSAARWDRSMLNSAGDETIFTEYFDAAIADSQPDMTPEALWRDIRDRMSAWSRPSGVLQSPFIANARPFAIGKSVAE